MKAVCTNHCGHNPVVWTGTGKLGVGCVACGHRCTFAPAVHQVAKGLCQECGHVGFTVNGICTYGETADLFGCGHVCAAAPAEVHQTPEQQKEHDGTIQCMRCRARVNLFAVDEYTARLEAHGDCQSSPLKGRWRDDPTFAPPDQHVPPLPWCSPCRSYHPYPQTIEHWRKLGCKADRRDFTVGDQHVAPPRITIHDPREGALRTVYTERITDPLLRDVEYLAAAPIQAALANCESASSRKDGVVFMNEEVWNALVKAVKGNHD